MFITFLLVTISYNLIAVFNKYWLNVIKFILFLWGIILIIFAILGFIYSSQMKNTDLDDLWIRLSESSKAYYGKKQSKLLDANVKNLILAASYYIVTGKVIK